MASSTGSEPTDELATAVGQYVLGDISLGRAAEAAGMTRWEFEAVLENAGFEALYGHGRTNISRTNSTPHERRRVDWRGLPAAGISRYDGPQ